MAPLPETFGRRLNLAQGLGLHRRRMHAHALQHRRDDALGIFHQRGQNVHRLQLGIAVLAGEIVRPLHRFLRLW